MTRITTRIAVAAAFLVPAVALAYIGPGAGLGLIGSLIAVLVASLLAIVGLVLLPYRMLRAKMGQKADDSSPSSHSDGTQGGAGPTD